MAGRLRSDGSDRSWRLRWMSSCDGDESAQSDEVQHAHAHRVDAHAQDAPLRPEDESHRVDEGEQRGECGEVDVAGAGARQNRIAGDDGCDEEEHWQKGVAPEDVTDREVVVALTDRLEAGGDLWQGGRQGQHRGAEKDAGEPDL